MTLNLDKQLLGQFTLSLSALVYYSLFVPQLWLNLRRKSIEGLSFLMHSIIFAGYLFDLGYGFSFSLPWQYRSISLVGSCFLLFQHYQFFRYGTKRFHFLLSTGALVGIGAISFLANYKDNSALAEILGFAAHACWLSYLAPQAWLNYCKKDTSGLSPVFISLGLFAAILDLVSGWALAWPLPSLVGPPFSILTKSLVLAQVFWYQSKKPILSLPA